MNTNFSSCDGVGKGIGFRIRMSEETLMEFQNETQGPSTSDFRAKGARQSSAQDGMCVVRLECLEHRNSEFAAILGVLAEGRWPEAESKILGGTYEL